MKRRLKLRPRNEDVKQSVTQISFLTKWVSLFYHSNYTNPGNSCDVTDLNTHECTLVERTSGGKE